MSEAWVLEYTAYTNKLPTPGVGPSTLQLEEDYSSATLAFHTKTCTTVHGKEVIASRKPDRSLACVKLQNIKGYNIDEALKSSETSRAFARK